jgi:hypothetical protein
VTALAEALYDEQAMIVQAATRAALDIWKDLDPTRFSASWVQDQIGDQLFLSLARAQELAAIASDVYTDLILADAGVEVDPDGDVVPSALSGVASDGRPLDSLLLQPLIQSNVAAAGGASLADSLLSGAAMLTRIVGTQVADTGRAATGLGIATRRQVGYVRLVEPKACSRCVILAGRWYRWSAGFDRHPLCKCRNIPAAEDTPELDAASDPMAHFRSLSETEQNRQFTKAGAQAIRDGADISRVVNARRGALGLNAPGALTRDDRRVVIKGGRLVRTDVAGRPVYLTSDGTTIRAEYGKAEIERGNARVNRSAAGQNLTVTTTPRLMPESIYEIATDREDAVRLLKRFGYISERSPLVDAQNAAARRGRESFAAMQAARGL